MRQISAVYTVDLLWILMTGPTGSGSGSSRGLTENASVVHALPDNLIGRGLDPVEWPDARTRGRANTHRHSTITIHHTEQIPSWQQERKNAACLRHSRHPNSQPVPPTKPLPKSARIHLAPTIPTTGTHIMSRHFPFISALCLLLLATAACAPGSASRYPSSAVAETSTIIATTAFHQFTTDDPDNPGLDFYTPECSALLCTYADGAIILEPFRTKLQGPPIPVNQVTTINNVSLFRNDRLFESGLRIWRLLGRGDYTAFVLEHLHSEPDFPTPKESLTAIASGEHPPTPETPIPAATWTGTAAIHTINSGDVAYFANATLTVPLPSDTPRRSRTSYLHIETPEPLNTDNAAPLRAMTLPYHRGKRRNRPDFQSRSPSERPGILPRHQSRRRRTRPSATPGLSLLVAPSSIAKTLTNTDWQPPAQSAPPLAFLQATRQQFRHARAVAPNLTRRCHLPELPSSAPTADAGAIHSRPASRFSSELRRTAPGSHTRRRQRGPMTVRKIRRLPGPRPDTVLPTSPLNAVLPDFARLWVKSSMPSTNPSVQHEAADVVA